MLLAARPVLARGPCGEGDLCPLEKVSGTPRPEQNLPGPGFARPANADPPDYGDFSVTVTLSWPSITKRSGREKSNYADVCGTHACV